MKSTIDTWNSPWNKVVSRGFLLPMVSHPSSFCSPSSWKSIIKKFLDMASWFHGSPMSVMKINTSAVELEIWLGGTGIHHFSTTFHKKCSSEAADPVDSMTPRSNTRIYMNLGRQELTLSRVESTIYTIWNTDTDVHWLYCHAALSVNQRNPMDTPICPILGEQSRVFSRFQEYSLC